MRWRKTEKRQRAVIYSCGLNTARLEVKLFTTLHPSPDRILLSLIQFVHDGDARRRICILTSNLILHWVLQSLQRNVFDKVEVVSRSDTQRHPTHRGTLLWQAPFFIILPFDCSCVVIDEAHRLTLAHRAGSWGGVAGWHEGAGRIWATRSSTTMSDNY